MQQEEVDSSIGGLCMGKVYIGNGASSGRIWIYRRQSMAGRLGHKVTFYKVGIGRQSLYRQVGE